MSPSPSSRPATAQDEKQLWRSRTSPAARSSSRFGGQYTVADRLGCARDRRLHHALRPRDEVLQRAGGARRPQHDRHRRARQPERRRDAEPRSTARTRSSSSATSKTPTSRCCQTNVVVATTTPGDEPDRDARRPCTARRSRAARSASTTPTTCTPLGLALDPNAVGMLTGRHVLLRVTAIMAGNGSSRFRRRRSRRRSDTTVASASLGRRAPARSATGSTGARRRWAARRGYFTSTPRSFFDDGTASPTCRRPARLRPRRWCTRSRRRSRSRSTPPRRTSRPRSTRCPRSAPTPTGTRNVTVTGGGGTYTIDVHDALGDQPIAALVGERLLAALERAARGHDARRWRRRRHLRINLIGGRTNSLVNVFDSGGDCRQTR